MVTGETTAWLGVNNEAKELFGSGSSGGGGSMVPTWLITSTQTWTVPVTGNYRLICIGKGGDGGSGAAYVFRDRGTSHDEDMAVYGYHGCGGAGGAVAIGEQKLTMGTVLTCSITDSESSINTTKLKATAGKNGYDAVADEYDYSTGSPPTITRTTPSGGIASGEWMTYGYNGNKPHTDTDVVTIYDSRNGNSYVGKLQRAGSIGTILFYPAGNSAGTGIFLSDTVNGTCSAAYGYLGSISSNDTLDFDNVPDRCKNVNIPQGGYAGCGGESGSLCLYAYNYDSSGTIYTFMRSGAGGKGGIGAILIQFLGE